MFFGINNRKYAAKEKSDGFTSSEDQIARHSLQTESLDPAAHHGVPHKALIAVDVHQAVVARNLWTRRKKTIQVLDLL